MRNFKFLKKNDGTNVHQFYGNDLELHYHIEDLQRHNQRLTQQLIEANERVQRLASRAYPDIQRVRDEQRIDRYMTQQFTEPNGYLEHLKMEQATRIARKLLEENLIEHTFRPEEPNGDYISRMEIKVQNIL